MLPFWEVMQMKKHMEESLFLYYWFDEPLPCETSFCRKMNHHCSLEFMDDCNSIFLFLFYYFWIAHSDHKTHFTSEYVKKFLHEQRVAVNGTKKAMSSAKSIMALFGKLYSWLLLIMQVWSTIGKVYSLRVYIP